MRFPPCFSDSRLKIKVLFSSTPGRWHLIVFAGHLQDIHIHFIIIDAKEMLFICLIHHLKIQHSRINISFLKQSQSIEVAAALVLCQKAYFITIVNIFLASIILQHAQTSYILRATIQCSLLFVVPLSPPLRWLSYDRLFFQNLFIYASIQYSCTYQTNKTVCVSDPQ